MNKIFDFVVSIFTMLAILPLGVSMVFYAITTNCYKFFDEVSLNWEQHNWAAAFLETLLCAFGIWLLIYILNEATYWVAYNIFGTRGYHNLIRIGLLFIFFLLAIVPYHSLVKSKNKREKDEDDF